ncbi:hypothetical protein GP486_000833 [Trichoglossum hirsutum]|uniref:Transfer RNA methyltransferase 82 n=1 Tax=Trichoglossum hirsutum TaxID=265104 RepID=A0A9P8LI67_9PEZI|nr:hypothetical protein GP486_000833 [Trichoglossum hirsutum]
MQHPFQCLQACCIPGSPRNWIVLAAACSQLNSLSLSDGALLQTLDISALKSIPDVGASSTQSTRCDEDGPSPEKRRKTSGDSAENRQGAAVLALTSTRDYRNAVVVTGGDKCIRVFKVEDNGHLCLLSERCMPKRPCAVAITPDDTTILCADKFGDVYSLPLHPLPEPTRVAFESIGEGSDGVQPPKKFVPAASNLTVHTARNLKALENQLRVTNKPSERAAPNFEHKLLLGHVSMLTDIACITLDASLSHYGKPRSYILTADRDEHIRVSRGPPQAHIIETFCLSHKEFVSKLCIPYWLPRTMVSGGGDGLLCVWGWMEGSMLQKVDMKLLVDEYLNTYSQLGCGNSTKQTRPASEELKGSPATHVVSIEDVEGSSEDGNVRRGEKAHEAPHIRRLTVSGIWSVSQTDSCPLDRDTEGKGRVGEILVSCEGISAIFVFALSMDSKLTYRDFIPLKGNALDVATFEGEPFVIVSVDTLHQCNSIDMVRDPLGREATLLQLLSRSAEGSWSDSSTTNQTEAINRYESFGIKTGHGESQFQALRDLLYKYQSLRKQEYEE